MLKNTNRNVVCDPRRGPGLSFMFMLAAILSVSVSAAKASDQNISAWEGPYFGAAIGGSYGYARPNTTIRRSTYFVAADKTQLDPLLDESLGGADIAGSLIWGYNNQRERWVYGVEADLTLFDQEEIYETGNINYVSQPASTFQFSTTLKSYGIASVRPRLGYVWDDSLFYVSAGPAVSFIEYDFQFTDTFQPQSSRTSESGFKIGAAFNVGTEYRLRQDWSLRADYMFTYFPRAVGTQGILETSAADGFDHDIDYQNHNLRVGLVKRF